MPLALFFFLRIVFSYLDFPVVPYKFQDCLFYFCEKCHCTFDRDCIEAADCSVLFYSLSQNGPLLGAVGSFDWAGGAFLQMPDDKITFINTTRIDSDMNDAYLGKW